MQNLVPALVAALLASVVTVVMWELVRGQDDGFGEAETLTPLDQASLAAESRSSGPAGPALTGGGPDPLVRELEMRVATLEDQLANLNGGSRQPVLSDEVMEQAASLSGPEAVDFVLGVLAQKEEDERRQREEERRQRNEERLLQEAGRIAENVGLDNGQKDVLFGVLLEEDARRTAFFEAMREGGDWGPGNRDQMREQMQSIAAWKEQQLAEKLGGGLAEDIKKYQDENSRGRGRGGFGMDRGGRGGGGGGRGGGRGN